MERYAVIHIYIVNPGHHRAIDSGSNN